nr:MAG TPA: hypothetical protein [Caudoviricetes sp.]
MPKRTVAIMACRTLQIRLMISLLLIKSIPFRGGRLTINFRYAHWKGVRRNGMVNFTETHSDSHPFFCVF